MFTPEMLPLLNIVLALNPKLRDQLLGAMAAHVQKEKDDADNTLTRLRVMQDTGTKPKRPVDSEPAARVAPKAKKEPKPGVFRGGALPGSIVGEAPATTAPATPVDNPWGEAPPAGFPKGTTQIVDYLQGAAAALGPGDKTSRGSAEIRIGVGLPKGFKWDNAIKGALRYFGAEKGGPAGVIQEGKTSHRTYRWGKL